MIENSGMIEQEKDETYIQDPSAKQRRQGEVGACEGQRAEKKTQRNKYKTREDDKIRKRDGTYNLFG